MSLLKHDANQVRLRESFYQITGNVEKGTIIDQAIHDIGKHLTPLLREFQMDTAVDDPLILLNQKANIWPFSRIAIANPLDLLKERQTLRKQNQEAA